MRIVQRVRGPRFWRRRRYYVVTEPRWSRRGHCDVVWRGVPGVELGPYDRLCEAFRHLRIARVAGLIDAMEVMRDASQT